MSLAGPGGGYRKLIYVQNVTELRTLQHATSQVQNRAEALFNLSPAPSVYVDVHSLIIEEASKHWSHLVGHNLGEVIELDEPWPETLRKARLYRHLALRGRLKGDNSEGEVNIEFLRNAGGEELLVVYVEG